MLGTGTTATCVALGVTPTNRRQFAENTSFPASLSVKHSCDALKETQLFFRCSTDFSQKSRHKPEVVGNEVTCDVMERNVGEEEVRLGEILD